MMPGMDTLKKVRAALTRPVRASPAIRPEARRMPVFSILALLSLVKISFSGHFVDNSSDDSPTKDGKSSFKG